MLEDVNQNYSSIDDVMVDLETYGTSPGCSIMSIGAIAFDELGLSGVKFYVVVDRQSCLDVGLTEDPTTVTWWNEQSDAAKVAMIESSSGKGVHIKDALTRFNKYLSARQEPTIWGNGSDFDNTILMAAYKACGIVPAWKFYRNRCFRTLKSLFPVIGESINRSGVHHNALDDAIYQATVASKIMDHIKNA